jgi:hypothetical protein
MDHRGSYEVVLQHKNEDICLIQRVPLYPLIFAQKDEQIFG